MYQLAAIIILGILAQWFAWKIKVPAILPLIIIGLLVGPISTYFTHDGLKWIEPMYKPELHHGLFPEDLLFSFVTLSIGIILFEGGMTLKIKEIKGIGPVIARMLFWGVIITFFGGSIAVHFLFGLNWTISYLFSSLIIVTGPTVIAPILRNISLNRNVATILKWEGILIDPIGALIAIIVFEFVVAGEGGHYMGQHAFQSFAKIVITGLSVGFTSAYLLYYLLKFKLIPDYLINIFTLALVLGVFIASDFLAVESGILSVVVMGMVLTNLKFEGLNHILHFKESLSILLISILFILLAANIDIKDLEYIWNWKVAILFVLLILVIRPVMVFISTYRSGLNIKEKLFISWVGPRGIVAAGIASLFGMKLTGQIPGAELLTPLVFMVVLGTVLINASTAKAIAKLLGVSIDKKDGVLIIGACKASRLMAKYLLDHGKHVVLLDKNKVAINKARELGLEAFEADIFEDDLNEILELNDIGYILAFTASSDVNSQVIEKYHDKFGKLGAYRLITADELKSGNKDIEDGIFSYNDDFINMVEIARDYPSIHEVKINDRDDFLHKLKKINDNNSTVPLFIINDKNIFKVIPADMIDFQIPENSKLVYMGEKIDFEEQFASKIE